jgi:hypothetical protein
MMSEWELWKESWKAVVARYTHFAVIGVKTVFRILDIPLTLLMLTMSVPLVFIGLITEWVRLRIEIRKDKAKKEGEKR